MKIKISSYYFFVLSFRLSLFLFPLPLQAILFKNITSHLFALVFLVDLSLVLTLFFFAYLSYKNTKLTISQKTLNFENGIMIKNRTFAGKGNISVLSFVRNPLQKLLRVCKVTFICSKKQISIYIPSKESSALSSFLHHQKRKSTLIFQNGFISTALLSLGFYNAFTSALTLIPVFRKTSRLLANRSSHNTPLNNLQTLSLTTEINLLLSAVILFISAMWCIGALVTFLKIHNLKVYKTSASIELRRGFFTSRFSCVNPKHISALVLRQNLLMSLLRRYTGEFRIAYEKKENTLTFICGENHRRCISIASLLLKGIEDIPTKKVTPHKNALWGYTYLPALCLMFFSVISVVADVYSPYVSKTHLSLFATLWLCVWFLFRVSAFNRSYISSNKSFLIMCTFRKMTFANVYMPKNKVLAIRITRSFFQRRRGTCSLHIFVKGRKKQTFTIKHIDNKKAAELVSELCG